MKKILFLTLIFALVGSSSAFALSLVTTIDTTREGTTEVAYVGPDGFVNSGSLVGVFTGNDSNQQEALQTWLQTDGGYGDDFTLEQYFKDEYSDDTASRSGEWSTTADITFYVVKAANAFALYLVDPIASSGSWSTYDIWLRGHAGEALEISHLSGYNAAAPVPEPATMFLFGTGLAAFFSMRRKKNGTC